MRPQLAQLQVCASTLAVGSRAVCDNVPGVADGAAIAVEGRFAAVLTLEPATGRSHHRRMQVQTVALTRRALEGGQNVCGGVGRCLRHGTDAVGYGAKAPL